MQVIEWDNPIVPQNTPPRSIHQREGSSAHTHTRERAGAFFGAEHEEPQTAITKRRRSRGRITATDRQRERVAADVMCVVFGGISWLGGGEGSGPYTPRRSMHTREARRNMGTSPHAAIGGSLSRFSAHVRFSRLVLACTMTLPVESVFGSWFGKD